MMRVGIHDADKTKFPNLALMKLAAYHKAKGDEIKMYMPLMPYDLIYSAKVFTFTEPDKPLGHNVIYGGTGNNKFVTLSEEVEHTMPDYSLYNTGASYGFLTRGCCNKCPWCIVPKKEGDIRKHADIEEFLAHRAVVLMDNNVLAHSHGIKQIEKIARLGVRVDFNQGLDARLIDSQIAARLARVRWIRFIRLACDRKSQMPAVERAVRNLHSAGYRGGIFCYVLVNDVADAWARVEFLRGLGVDPFAQPYRDFDKNLEPTQEQKQFARWVNHKAIFKSVNWEQYQAQGQRALGSRQLSLCSVAACE